MNIFADLIYRFKRLQILILLSSGFFCSCIISQNTFMEKAVPDKPNESPEVSSEYFSFEEKDEVSVFQSSTSLSDEADLYTEYIVRGGDTLMLIAFNLYGDYLRWREIYELNRSTFEVGHELKAGMRLKLSLPLSPHRRPTGLPYLIKSGDSLSLISKKVYGDMNEWPRIWHNNPIQIREPNLIFAGFTLFYPERNYFMNEPF